MVSEVQVDDDRVAEELFKEQTSIAGTNNKVKVTATTTSSTIAAPPFELSWILSQQPNIITNIV